MIECDWSNSGRYTIHEDLDILDKDGYPTQDFLLALEEYPPDPDDWCSLSQNGKALAVDDLMHTISKAWKYSEPEIVIHPNGSPEKQAWELCTGGWSGNEDIIRALQRNKIFWSSYWVLSTRGGRHVFDKLTVFTNPRGPARFEGQE